MQSGFDCVGLVSMNIFAFSHWISFYLTYKLQFIGQLIFTAL